MARLVAARIRRRRRLPTATSAATNTFCWDWRSRCYIVALMAGAVVYQFQYQYQYRYQSLQEMYTVQQSLWEWNSTAGSTSSQSGTSTISDTHLLLDGQARQRHDLYRERYHYLPPQQQQLLEQNDDTNANANNRPTRTTASAFASPRNPLLCGRPPQFETYFQQDYHYRSSTNEDNVLFRLFQTPFLQAAGGGNNHTFVELGAFDGLFESNTRFFEECLGWTGLLIEGNPKQYPALIQNRPRTHRMNYAPSCNDNDDDNDTTMKSHQTISFHAVKFTNAGLEGYAKDYPAGHETVEVACGSLTPVLQDILEGHVTLFSLDVEGAEALVLEHVDFDKVQIDILMVESWNAICKPEPADCVTRTQVRRRLQKVGYQRYSQVIMKSDLYIHPQSPYQIPPDSHHQPDG